HLDIAFVASSQPREEVNGFSTFAATTWQATSLIFMILPRGALRRFRSSVAIPCGRARLSPVTIRRFDRPGVAGFLHRPSGASGRGLVLTHGAGSDCAAPVLVAAAEAFAAAGTAVLRCDLPFRQRRRTGPPSPAGAAEDRAGLRAAVAALREE